MSLPAPLSASPPMALLRRGLGAALPAVKVWAGIGAAPAGQYRSAFAPRLRVGRIAVLALALLWLAAGLYAVGATAGVVRTVGHDTAPSIAAAERIRTGLAGANADFALAILSGEGTDGTFLSAMHRELRAVRGAIVEAAGNVTYGDEERGPIGTVLQGLGDYEQLVGRALASQDATRGEAAFQADDLLHWSVLPAAVTLERVNANHLSEDYRAYLGGYVLPWWLVAALVLMAALVIVQADMALTARRLLNPGMLVATLLVVATTAFVALRIAAAQSDLHVAKADAFDSVYALSTARALAADADAAGSFAILAGADRARADRFLAVEGSLSRRLLDADPSVALQQAERGDRLPGYLGDELANITFAGERVAAYDAVRSWVAVTQFETGLRSLLSRGASASATALKSSDSGPARRAFAQFDAALAKVLSIDRDAFSAAVSSAERDTGPLVPVILAALAGTVASVWFGIGRRLDDYRF